MTLIAPRSLPGGEARLPEEAAEGPRWKNHGGFHQRRWNCETTASFLPKLRCSHVRQKSPQAMSSVFLPTSQYLTFSSAAQGGSELRNICRHIQEVLLEVLFDLCYGRGDLYPPGWTTSISVHHHRFSARPLPPEVSILFLSSRSLF